MEVSNADRVVFPEVGKTKGDVVAYYDRMAARVLPHVRDRPLSIRRYPKGLAGAGFFQKNVPAHYPDSILRYPVPRSSEATKKHRTPRAKAADVTLYPLVRDASHLPYLANQGAIELHIPTARASEIRRPDRFIIDLDPPAGAFALAQRAALSTRDALREYGLDSVPIATGSKGYHVVVAITPAVDVETLALAAQQFAALLESARPDMFTTQYRIALRGERVFIDWLRNNPMASVVAPYSLRATARASVATPLSWDEIAHTAPNAFTIDDASQLIERPDSLADLAASDAALFAARVGEAFETSGLELQTFDRFGRS